MPGRRPGLRSAERHRRRPSSPVPPERSRSAARDRRLRDIDNAANKAFVADFQKAYGRLPSLYASQGYDAARLIGSALKATGGMRLVPEPERGRIMAEVRRYLAASLFDLQSAVIISGQQEALFGWMTVNYMLGLLGDGGPFPTVGALDLGGASTQITFLPLDYPEASAASPPSPWLFWLLWSPSSCSQPACSRRARVGRIRPSG